MLKIETIKIQAAILVSFILLNIAVSVSSIFKKTKQLSILKQQHKYLYCRIEL